MTKFIWIFLVVLAGSLLPIQAGLNTKMGKAIESPVWASLISFAVGTIVMLIYAGVTKQGFSVSELRNVPAHTWLAGVLGAFYVTTIVLAFPRLGPALTFGLVVAGQLFISLLLDHFNILVQAQHSINIFRVIGMLLIIAGVVIIRSF
ncbi:DMT family transporter [Arcicella sp. DC2W]|uniref:DMT family transporter n=1 Tax=Arcicella gelida TaxID=2984195 RepID=A0ABU5S350_9BACT|nr:DMT family transporter [Arcicella sp. DC2W]MEA5402925.1 DMT family transporter [Arcicella sp. DC2W]